MTQPIELPLALFIYPHFSSFVKCDYHILEKFFHVKSFHYHSSKKLLPHLISQIKLFFWLLKNIKTARIVYIWFADYHSLLPVFLAKLFKKDSFMVLGGYDVIHIPEIDYGSLKNPIRRFCTIFSIRNANGNLAVSRYVKEKALQLCPQARVEVLYNGVDTEIFVFSSHLKEDFILTVASGDTLQRIKLKGLDFFCEIARHLPQYRFYIIGLSEKARRFFSHPPDNLHFLEKMDYQKLKEFYQKARVYCQFSIVESFGMAIVEAMSCGCIPVVFNTGAMPEIVGNAGYVIPKNLTEASHAIERALKDDERKWQEARQRVENHFTFELRKKKLLDILHPTKIS